MKQLLNFSELRQGLHDDLASLPAPNYGWWLTTRDHISASELITTCQFLYALSRGNFVVFSPRHYDELQRALGRTVPVGGAGRTLRRHLLLNMLAPLRLIERRPPTRWRQIRLTQLGEQIAQGYPVAHILEQQLKQMRFAKQPWFPPDRTGRYAHFSVSPHRVLITVLERTEGWLGRDEYRLFVAHQRTNTGLQNLIRCIMSFRNLEQSERKILLADEERLFRRAGGNWKKRFDNWRDMDLHTFTLMSLGTTFVRIRDKLQLTQHVPGMPQRVVLGQPTLPEQIVLRQPSRNPSLATPPAPPIQGNTGYDAEKLVADLLRADGFEVVDYTRVRGFGFDLWVRRHHTGEVFFVEVKSSHEQVRTVTLTPTEYQAARQYGDNYLLVIVENLGQATPHIWIVQNPVQQIPTLAHQYKTVEHRARRSAWRSVAQKHKL